MINNNNSNDDDDESKNCMVGITQNQQLLYFHCGLSFDFRPFGS